MANISFDQISVGESSGVSNNNVAFFTLKNDGDEAVVRIMHDSTADFDIVTTHSITLNGKFRRVNCLRTPMDSMDKCPICASGDKVQQRIYIHMIQYMKDEQGRIVAQPVVWERSIQYAVTLKNYIDEYGPLSDCIFKIRRSGVAGSRDTSYSIIFGNPNVYRNEMYPKIANAFDNYRALGNVVLDKSFDDISTFMATGNFPQTQKQVANQQTSVTPQTEPYVNDNPYPVNNTPPHINGGTTSNAYTTNVQTTPVRDTMVNPNTHQYIDNNTNAPQRPVRYY